MRDEKGFSLIETVVALGIMAAIAVGFLSALATSSKAAIVTNEMVAAESLAKTHMECIKGNSYSTGHWDYTVTTSLRSSTQQPSWWDGDNPPLLPSQYVGYSVEAVTADTPDADEDIRLITITVSRPAIDPDPILITESYKVDR